MWELQDLKRQMNDYFENTTKEQFLKDIESAGCSHLIVDAGDDQNESDKKL